MPKSVRLKAIREMAMQENNWLVCNHLTHSPEDIEAIRAFSVVHPTTGEGLERYLKEDALMDEDEGFMRTYLARHRQTGDLVGYFSLKAGLVALNERRMPDSSIAFDTVPGVELANFAINRRFLEKYHQRRMGGIVFHRLVVPLVLKFAESLGIYLLYIFALPQPKLIETYHNYGFQRLSDKAERLLHMRLKPSYDESCIFMFQTLVRLKELMSR
ncbi:MAG: hypothetical protein IKZ84_19755 [Victivallales bacterium]|nr:hypothetical protein [Victivallales bacterium]